MSPIQGSCWIVFWPMLRSSPPITKVWPSRSSTVVRARRTISGGIDRPAICTTLLRSSSLTSGSTVMLISPSPSTVGVKASWTPKRFHSIVIWPSAPGTGNGKLAAGEEARGVAG